jgi:hypothetical protein
MRYQMNASSMKATFPFENNFCLIASKLTNPTEPSSYRFAVIDMDALSQFTLASHTCERVDEL